MPKTTKEFDKAKYDKEYHQNNYKNFSIVMKIDEASRVEEAAQRLGVTKSAFMKSAILKAVEEAGK